MSIRTERVALSELPSLAGPWAELLAGQRFPDPTRRAEWLLAWWEAFGAPHGRREPLVLAAWRGSELVGAAPLMLEHFPGRLRVLRHFGTSPHWFDPDFLVAPGHADARVALAAEISRVPCDLIALEDLAMSGPTISELVRAIPGATARSSGGFRHRYLVETPPRLTKRRKKSRRRERRASELGYRIEIDVTSDRGRVSAGLDEALDLLDRVWTPRGNASEVTDPIERRYVRTALGGLPSDAATLVSVRANGRLAAFDLALRLGRGAVLFRGSRDPAEGPSGTGWISILATVDALLAAGAAAVDFGKFPWPYKLEISSQPRAPLVTLEAGRGPRGTAAMALWRARPLIHASRRRAKSIARRLGRATGPAGLAQEDDRA